MSAQYGTAAKTSVDETRLSHCLRVEARAMEPKNCWRPAVRSSFVVRSGFLESTARDYSDIGASLGKTIRGRAVATRFSTRRFHRRCARSFDSRSTAYFLPANTRARDGRAT